MREVSKTYEWSSVQPFTAAGETKRTVEITRRGAEIRSQGKCDERYAYVYPEEIDDLILALMAARSDGIKMFGWTVREKL